MLLHTNTNKTLLFGCCKTAERGEILSSMTSSKDAGQTRSEITTPPGLGQAVYSAKSSTIIMTVGFGQGQEGGAAAQFARHHHVEFEPAANNCTTFFEGVCPGLYGKNQSCVDCVQAYWAAHGRGFCSKQDVHRIAAQTTSPETRRTSPAECHRRPHRRLRPPLLPLLCHRTRIALIANSRPSQLPKLTPEQLAKCQTGIIRSTDDGITFLPGGRVATLSELASRFE
jgi:hypothetical protein